MNNDITAVEGIKVGSAENKEAGTGCSVILCEEGFTVGADVRGGAPASREIALTAPENAVSRAHAVFLTGGSAFGLDAAGGVMRFLAEKKVGFQTVGGAVPIVPAAAIYDLEYKSNHKPDQEMAYQACKKAKTGPLKAEAIGAATGATCGKLRGMEFASKTVLGHSARKNGELVVAAFAVVNAFFDIYDRFNNKIIAGAKDEDGNFINSEDYLLNTPLLELGFSNQEDTTRKNTTLIVVATNAILNSSEAKRTAVMAHSGMSRSICPVHTMMDGDTIFTLASNKVKADINQLGITAARVVEEAVHKAAKL